MKSVALFLALLLCGMAHARDVTPQMAIAAEKAGNHEEAIKLFSVLADTGDSKAMIHVGNKYYSGDGADVDYTKAMDWWLRAFHANNGDAPGNIGVLYRDGKGVEQNRKIAYTLFLATHMEGLGSESTQIRVNRHLRREADELSRADIEEALCYTWEYVLAYIEARGQLAAPPEEVLPASGKTRLKDNGWWLESERKDLKFSCASPWN